MIFDFTNIKIKMIMCIGKLMRIVSFLCFELFHINFKPESDISQPFIPKTAYFCSK